MAHLLFWFTAMSSMTQDTFTLIYVQEHGMMQPTYLLVQALPLQLLPSQEAQPIMNGLCQWLV